MSRLIHTGLGSSSLVAHVLHSPPPPREQLYNRSCSNKTHTHFGKRNLSFSQWLPRTPKYISTPKNISELKNISVSCTVHVYSALKRSCMHVYRHVHTHMYTFADAHKCAYTHAHMLPTKQIGNTSTCNAMPHTDGQYHMYHNDVTLFHHCASTRSYRHQTADINEQNPRTKL